MNTEIRINLGSFLKTATRVVLDETMENNIPVTFSSSANSKKKMGAGVWLILPHNLPSSPACRNLPLSHGSEETGALH